MLTFDSLQKRVIADADVEIDDEDARFMWNALIVATSAPGYRHLTPEETFEHLYNGTHPQQQESKYDEPPRSHGCPHSG